MNSKRCAIWQKLVLRSDAAEKKFLATTLSPKFIKFSAFDHFEPTWSCEALERLPNLAGDGPKWVCGAEYLPPRPLVYSFGCDGDTQFEEGIRRLHPGAEIFVFDPTMTASMAKAVKEQGFTLLEEALLRRGETSFSFQTNVMVNC